MCCVMLLEVQVPVAVLQFGYQARWLAMYAYTAVLASCLCLQP